VADHHFLDVEVYVATITDRLQRCHDRLTNGFHILGVELVIVECNEELWWLGIRY
jgi:hypothetical protein